MLTSSTGELSKYKIKAELFNSIRTMAHHWGISKNRKHVIRRNHLSWKRGWKENICVKLRVA